MIIRIINLKTNKYLFSIMKLKNLLTRCSYRWLSSLNYIQEYSFSIIVSYSGKKFVPLLYNKDV